MLTLAMTLASAAGSQDSALTSFYVMRSHSSDAMGVGDNYDELLDAVEEGAGVRVRLIRYSEDYAGCDGGALEAVERVLPGVTVRSLAGQDVCAQTSAQVDRAVRPATRRNAGFLSENHNSIVATCGVRNVVLRVPVHPVIKWTVVEHRDPAVASALRMFDRVRDRVFGREVRFDDAMGTALIPYLQSGRFSAVFPAQAFAGYTGPHRRLLPAELLERDTLPLEVYRPAPYPSMAVSAGVRIDGDVRLRLRVSSTGTVTDVQVLESIPLADRGAVGAARSWKFKPQALAGEQVDVTLRFQQRCGS